MTRRWFARVLLFLVVSAATAGCFPRPPAGGGSTPPPATTVPTTTTVAPPTTTTAAPTTTTTAPPPQACTAGGSAQSTPLSGIEGADTLSPSEAASDAAAEVAPGTETALTLVSLDEEGRPEFTSVSADTPAEAASIASSAAAGDDLIAVEADAPVSVGTTATDPQRSSQWALNSTSFETAWTCSTGTGTVVAVVDTGVAASHPDLAGRVLSGWEFLNNSVTGVSGGGTDPHGHGTHVAGIIGAAADNGTAIAGAAPGVSILPVRVLASNGSGSSADVGRGITWAVDHGADVINLSLGSTAQSTSISTAVDYAMANGVVVVASAGNSGNSGSPTNWPAADPDTIAVAAIQSDGTRASYSNQGAYVDIAAPGSGILSLSPNGGTVSMSGTSMAAPYVSALAALLIGNDPGMTIAEVRSAIEGTATDRGTAGWDSSYGWGVINPASAIGA